MGSDGQKVKLDLDAVRAMTGACAYNPTRLADALGVSGRHLRRLFMRELRCPPRTWLREERLQTARRLLRRTATVQEVAHALSFRNASQFCRDFRARFGQTPSELKRGVGLLGRPDSAPLAA
jgi:transcriptional regulator GlxA family with amidase domain